MTHHFNTDAAKEYGIEAAVILDNIFYWCAHNAANNRNIYDGVAWTYNSAKGFQKIYSHMSVRKIADTLRLLEKEGLVRSAILSENPYDKTKWYTVTRKALELLGEYISCVAGSDDGPEENNFSGNQIKTDEMAEESCVQGDRIDSSKTEESSAEKTYSRIFKNCSIDSSKIEQSSVQKLKHRIGENRNIDSTKIEHSNIPKSHNVFITTRKPFKNNTVKPLETNNFNFQEKTQKKFTQFEKPSLKDVTNYCLENRLNVSPEIFWYHYEGIGWTVGNKPVVNWQMMALKWHENNLQESKAQKIRNSPIGDHSQREADYANTNF